MNAKELIEKIIPFLGGKANILDVKSCMTRLRIVVEDADKVDLTSIENMDDVIQVVHDENSYYQIVLGPGKARDAMDEMTKLGIPEKKKELPSEDQENIVKGIRVIADIFTPMIPAFIASGMCNGLAKIVLLCMQSGYLPDTSFWNIVQQLLMLVSDGFLAYLAIYTGINSAKQFGVNEMLGGLVGAASIHSGINTISQLLGWYSEITPAESLLSSGAGGIIGVVFGVWVLSKVEKFIHAHMPQVLDTFFTPLCSMLVVMPLYVLTIMPAAGFISNKLAEFLSLFLMSDNVVVSAITGYVLAALFLPMVLVGLHRGLVPIYALQIEKMGGTTLFPAVAMAGAGQVGAAIALYFKAKHTGNKKLQSVISGAVPAGVLGIGEPLIYGVTLPLMKPFFTAGLGAGFGGAWCMVRHVAATSYSPSGVLGVTIMTPETMIDYLIGLLIACVMGGIITWILIPESLAAEK